MPRDRSLQIAAAVCLGLLLASACTPPGQAPAPTLAKDQVLRLNISAEPGSFDPGQQQYTYEAAVGRQTWEALLKPRPDLADVQPATAESYAVSPDGLTYTFKIRKSSKYSDGVAVKAQDFVFAWQRLIDPRQAAPLNDYYVGVIKGAPEAAALKPSDPADKIDAALKNVGLKAADESTFVVTLAEPAAYFKWVATLWNGAPIRQDVVARGGNPTDPKNNWASKIENLVGNGAYRVTDIAHNDHITLEANPGYWGGKPTLTRIVENVIRDDNADFAKYQNGDEDMVSVPVGNREAVRSDPKYKDQLLEFPRQSATWLEFNQKAGPFTNRNLRAALTESVDRTKWVSRLLGGVGIPATTLVPRGMPGHHPELGDALQFDAARAKADLGASGVNPAATDLRLMARDSVSGKAVGEFLIDQWKTNLGITVKLDVLPSKELNSRLRRQEFQIYVGGWIGDYPDLQNWFDIFLCGSTYQYGKYCSSDYDRLVKAADREHDAGKREAMYTQAQQVLIKEVGAGFLVHGSFLYLKKPYVRGVKTTGGDEWPGCFFATAITIAPH
jgi:oligopeptide transport system substrate-binding protein